jgi:2-polyprenyl-3-methyl-5-hydroxy-6-metoxy-1,4-benzoquinol methylase
MNSPCYNWDRSSWLSSKQYFQELSSHLIKLLDIREDKKILDVGCGRGHLLETLALDANLINQPVGVEPVKHDDFIPQNVKIFHSSVNLFLNENNSQFDLVILKQVLHLLTLDERKNFYHDIKNHINEDAHIVFIHMNDQTEIPLFPLMENKLNQSLKSHQFLLEELTDNFHLMKFENFNYNVEISLEEYLEMIRNRYMTVLLDLKENEIEEGVDFIKNNYPNQLVFQDTLTIKVFN